MAISGRSFDPTRVPPVPSGPVVDYRLARRAALAELRNGSLDTAHVCDAHPELMRAAKNIGEDSPMKCPVCSHESLRLVRYVFGDDLKRDNGRVVYPSDFLEELAERHEQFTCYVVEVCVDCAWNHLIRAYQAGTRFGHQNGNGTNGRSKRV
jgi:hypothetical protein